MKPHWILAIAGISIIIAGISGYLGEGAAALIGGGVFSFAILFALTYYIFDIRPSRKGVDQEGPGNEGEPEPDLNEANTYHPELARLGNDEEFLKENEMVRDYMEDFGISKDKAQNLYDAGYTHWGDFSEAIPEDLVMVDGINPTISRRIISVVRSR